MNQSFLVVMNENSDIEQPGELTRIKSKSYGGEIKRNTPTHAIN